MPLVCAIFKDSSENRTDKYEADWNGFWQFFNLMQFSNNFVGVTSVGIEQLIYSKLPSSGSTIHDMGVYKQSEDDDWSKIREELFDEEAIALAAKLQAANVRIPSAIGYELTGANDSVIAECEMAWEAEKVAALLSEQIDNKEVFENTGWITFTLNDDIPSEIKGGKK